MDGNPVRIGDGSATVSGNKPPTATGLTTGKAGARFEARSQETGPTALVCAQVPRSTRALFSAQEKDEARQTRL